MTKQYHVDHEPREKLRVEVGILIFIVVVILLRIVNEIYKYRSFTGDDRVTLAPMVWRASASCWAAHGQFRFKLTNCTQIPEGSVIAVTGSLDKGSDNAIFGQKSLKTATFSLVSSTPASPLYWQAKVQLLMVQIRDWLLTPVRQTVSYPEEALVESFVLGAAVVLPEDIKHSVKVMGIAHVIAVSGSHLTLVIGLLLPVVRSKKSTINTSIIIVFLLLYTTLVGWQPAVTRAFLMSAILMLGKTIFHRQVSFPRSLIASSLLMLVANPWVVFDIGWRLSVLATAGLSWVYPAIASGMTPQPKLVPILAHLLEKESSSWQQKLSLGWQKLAHISLEATLASCSALMMIWPIMIESFGTWSWGTILSSLLLWWLFPLVISSCFIGVIVVRLVSLVCMNQAIVQLCSSLLLEWPVRSVTWLFASVDRFDWLVIATGDWPDSIYFAWYCLLGAGLLLQQQFKNNAARQRAALRDPRLPHYLARYHE